MKISRSFTLKFTANEIKLLDKYVTKRGLDWNGTHTEQELIRFQSKLEAARNMAANGTGEQIMLILIADKMTSAI